MKYIALLRGINVGGNNKVAMAKLRLTFERLGLTEVVTYINSGNVLFTSSKAPQLLANEIERAVEKDFGFSVNVIVVSQAQLRAIEQAIPKTWVNDQTTKTDVLFLWPEVDSKQILNELVIKPGIDEVRYLPGAVVWRINLAGATKTGLLKIVGTPLYKKVTIRNINTLRKLSQL